MADNYFLSASGMDRISKEQLDLPQLIKNIIEIFHRLKGGEIIFTVGQYSSPPGNEMKYVFKQKSFYAKGPQLPVDSKFNRRLFVISYINDDEAIIRFERKFDVSCRNQDDFFLDLLKVHANIKGLPADAFTNGCHYDGPDKIRPHTLIGLRHFDTIQREILLCNQIIDAIGVTQ
ncbi:hypothetical protein QWY20_17070 [Alkalimonas sp. MEB108]|uniref:Uncharacterized protein n=1 Tax=Alkalimonas cellulosilytica TaxID=3058395 RepID=A0ABU7JA72_9GAMM|nr:hypothetical protein [Alkalimonas sp. MEB108]MEE2003168.1 hypothetical protein [Alkalimonas sp. MEB108]